MSGSEPEYIEYHYAENPSFWIDWCTVHLYFTQANSCTGLSTMEDKRGVVISPCL